MFSLKSLDAIVTGNNKTSKSKKTSGRKRKLSEKNVNVSKAKKTKSKAAGKLKKDNEIHNNEKSDDAVNSLIISDEEMTKKCNKKKCKRNGNSKNTNEQLKILKTVGEVNDTTKIGESAKLINENNEVEKILNSDVNKKDVKIENISRTKKKKRSKGNNKPNGNCGPPDNSQIVKDSCEVKCKMSENLNSNPQVKAIDPENEVNDTTKLENSGELVNENIEIEKIGRPNSNVDKALKIENLNKNKRSKRNKKTNGNCSQPDNSQTIKDSFEIKSESHNITNANISVSRTKKKKTKKKSKCNASKESVPFYQESAVFEMCNDEIEKDSFLSPLENSITTSSKEFNKKTKERRKYIDSEHIAVELSIKESLIGYPLDKFKTNEETYVVVLEPEKSMYVLGLFSIRPLIGSVSVLGYTIQELEKQCMYSFSSHALLSINADEGRYVNDADHKTLLSLGLLEDQLSLIKNQTGPIVIVELQKSNLSIEKKLCMVGQQSIMVPKWIRDDWDIIINKENSKMYSLLRISDEWKPILENVILHYECESAPIIMVCGGQGVGKSTFFKFLVNGLLGIKKRTQIMCLDADPGQSEFSLPSCVSLTQITEPLLGPSYTHLFDPLSPNATQIMVGDISPQFGIQRYVQAIKDLYKRSQNHADCPLIVNTMGWCKGTGIDLIVDTIRIVKPTHVIQLQSRNRNQNFEMKLKDTFIQECSRGILTKQKEVEVHYNFLLASSLATKSSGVVIVGRKMLREIAVLMEFGEILKNLFIKKDDIENNMSILQWPNIAIHICGKKVPKERILQALNGNLVALCQVNASKIEFVSSDLPKHFLDDVDLGTCVGWGVVKGIDPITKELHILTKVPEDVMSSQVNAIIKPDLHLPEKFYKFFTKGEGPYFQTMYRTGAGRLKVDRQLRPGMAKFGGKKRDE